jgi:hypothetical protein
MSSGLREKKKLKKEGKKSAQESLAQLKCLPVCARWKTQGFSLSP